MRLVVIDGWQRLFSEGGDGKWRNSIDVVEGGKAVLAAVGVVIGEPGLDLDRQWGGSWQQCAWSVLPSLNVLDAHRAVQGLVSV
jgi:hypothetical protein